MYKQFENMDVLFDYVNEDKVMTGINSATAGRFPVRFVLFHNFNDCYDFVDRLTCNGVELQSVDYWLDPEFPDLMITYSRLADRICSYVRDNEDTDIVIAPFSELARFYNNTTAIEFDSLISTVKAIDKGSIYPLLVSKPRWLDITTIAKLPYGTIKTPLLSRTINSFSQTIPLLGLMVWRMIIA